MINPKIIIKIKIELLFGCGKHVEMAVQVTGKQISLKYKYILQYNLLQSSC